MDYSQCNKMTKEGYYSKIWFKNLLNKKEIRIKKVFLVNQIFTTQVIQFKKEFWRVIIQFKKEIFEILIKIKEFLENSFQIWTILGQLLHHFCQFSWFFFRFTESGSLISNCIAILINTDFLRIFFQGEPKICLN